MLKRPFTRVFLTLLLTAGWLLAYPFLYRQIPFLQQHFRTYHYFQRFVDPAPVNIDSTAMVPDSLGQPLDSLSDSSVVVVPEQAPVPLAIPQLEGAYQGLNHLRPFFEALAGGDEQVRIAYYGDSSIEGDLMCMTFRDSLQRRFGGRGVGFMPIRSEIAGFRRSVRHFFSDNWERSMIGQPNVHDLPRGISGEYFVALDASASDTIRHDSTMKPADETHWVSYRGSSRFAGARTFSRARVFYGHPRRDSAAQTYGRLYARVHGQTSTYQLRTPHLVNALEVSDTAARRIRLQFEISANYPIFGVSLESPTGIIVDNYPCRGNAGRATRGISRSVLAAFQEHLDYDLIILQYGLNVIDAHLTNYQWYEDQLVDVIRHFQEAMPGVPVLLIGVADKATKLNGQMQTDPGVPRVNNVQRAAAQRTGVAFFSLYQAMGGAGSMVRWVQNERPRLANYDYTHFNFRGARIASELLLDHLLGSYEAHQKALQGTELE